MAAAAAAAAAAAEHRMYWPRAQTHQSLPSLRPHTRLIVRQCRSRSRGWRLRRREISAAPGRRRQTTPRTRGSLSRCSGSRRAPVFARAAQTVMPRGAGVIIAIAIIKLRGRTGAWVDCVHGKGLPSIGQCWCRRHRRRLQTHSDTRGGSRSTVDTAVGEDSSVSSSPSAAARSTAVDWHRPPLANQNNTNTRHHPRGPFRELNPCWGPSELRPLLANKTTPKRGIIHAGRSGN